MSVWFPKANGLQDGIKADSTKLVIYQNLVTAGNEYCRLK